ncbi:MAG: MFS transporter [Actinomycetaceae bacterium]|nr:MFS transporter [Actinomycetaceae bacterium]
MSNSKNDNTKIKNRKSIFLNIIITTFATSALATSLATALPAIMDDMHIHVTTARWLTSGYILTMAIMMPLTAFFAKRVPTKRLYIAALVLFTLGLGGNVFAPTFAIMMTSRILQAIGGGILKSLGQMLILYLYPEGKRGTAMGWYAFAMGAAPIIAPTVTGVLIDISSWRVFFYITIGAMLFSLVMAIYVFTDILDVHYYHFDVLSFVLSVFAFGGIVLGFGNGGKWDIVSWQVGGVFLIGFISGVFFVHRQVTIESPLLNMKLFHKNVMFVLAAFTVVMYHIVMYGSSLMLPLYVQNIRHESATISAFVLMPGAIMMTILSPLLGRLYDRVGVHILLISGGFFLAISTGLMYFSDLSTSLWLVAVVNMVRGAAQASLMSTLVTWAISAVQKSQTPDATAIVASLRSLSTATGSAVFIGIMDLVARESDLTGDMASMHGFNVSFGLMALPGFIIMGVGIIVFVCDRKKRASSSQNFIETNVGQ